jgi:hypothetical protein
VDEEPVMKDLVPRMMIRPETGLVASIDAGGKP